MKRIIPLVSLLILFITPSLKAQLAANFTATPDSGCAPVFVTFRDATTGGTPSYYSWELITSSSTAPIGSSSILGYNFTVAGTYTVVETVAFGTDTSRDTQTVFVSPPPVLGFFASDTILTCPPATICFTNTSTDTNVCTNSWSWIISDPSAGFHMTLTGANACYNFTQPGNYNVELVLTNCCGTYFSPVKSSYIQIATQPVASFSVTNADTICHLPDSVHYYNTSTGAVSYLWLFGGGGTSTLVNPVHAFTAAGTYSDTLVAYSSGGCSDTFVLHNTAILPVFHHGFVDSGSLCTGDTVWVRDTTTGLDGNKWTVINSIDSAIDIVHNARITYFIFPGTGSYTIIDSSENEALGCCGCADTFSRTVVIRSSPTVTVTDDPNYYCKTPAVINFTATATPSGSAISSYFWNFEDPASGALDMLRQLTASATTSTNHTYSATGTYTPYVEVTDASGCYASANAPMILIGAPVAHPYPISDSGCTPLLVVDSFNFTPTFLDSLATVTEVTYGDGSAPCFGAACGSASHTYTASGSYYLKTYFTLPASVGGCAFHDSFNIHTGIIHPDFNITISPTDSVCPNTIVTFADNCTNCTSQAWSNITGTGEVTSPPGFTYTTPADSASIGITHLISPGAIDSVRWLGDVNGCYVIVDTFLYVFEPYAVIHTSTANCDSYRTVTFSGTTSTGGVGFYWNFGDGSTATGSPAIHTYSVDGTYTVIMVDTANAANHNCTNSDTLVINVYRALDTFGLVTDTPFCNNERVNFTGPLSPPAGNLYSQYVWMWGDGTVSTITTSNDLFHIYSTDGTYTVNLGILTTTGCYTTSSVPIVVHIYGPQMNLSGDTLLCADAPATFIDFSTDPGGRITERNWVYNSPGPPVLVPGIANVTTYTYSVVGNYLLCVIDTDNHHCWNNTCMNVDVVQPVASFSCSSTGQLCAGIPITFCDSNTNCTYTWIFGDGSSLTTATPCVTHIYTANGVYYDSVYVTTIGGGGFPAGCKSDSVGLAVPVILNAINAAFSITSGTVTNCPPLSGITFNNTSPFGAYTYWWQVDTSNSYHSGSYDSTGSGNYFSIPYNFIYPGNYSVILFDSSSSGCKGSDTVNFVVGGPEGRVTVTPDNGCVPLAVNYAFIDTGTAIVGTYLWVVDVPDTDNSPNTTATYSVAGVYNNLYLVITSSGTSGPPCTVLFPINDSITVYPVPTVTVTSPPLICYGASTTITASGGNTYLWVPGVGLSCNTCPSPVASPTATTTYVVTAFTIHNCIDTASVTLVVDTPLHVVIHGTDSVCQGLPDTLSASGIYNGVYQWYFNGVGTCLICDTTVILSNISTQTDTVIGIDGRGCKDTATFKVTVNPPPNILWAPDPAYVCNGDSTQIFVFTHNDSTLPNMFEWQPKYGGSLSCTSCNNPYSSLTSSLIYTVVATTIHGCIDSTYIPVTVYYLQPTQAGDDTAICFGTSAYLHAFGGQSYSWSPGANINDSTLQSPTVTPDTTTNYVVTVFENVCFSPKDTVTVTVIPIPVVSVTPSQFSLIAGYQTTLCATETPDTSSSLDGTVFTWAPVNGSLNCYECACTIAVPTMTTTYTVTATTIQGCHGDAEATINIICESTQVFIPNTFTPNGDGVNDRFYLSGRGLGLIKRMAVYNRWGQLVFEVEDAPPNEPGFGWDGTYKGTVLEPDVFVYVIDVYCETGTLFHYTGDISLVR